LVSDEDSDDADGTDEEEAAWPEDDGPDGRRGGGEAGDYRDSEVEGFEGVGPSGDGGHLEDGDDDHVGSDDGEAEGEDGWRDARRVEMIRELYPENIYAVGSGT